MKEKLFTATVELDRQNLFEFFASAGSGFRRGLVWTSGALCILCIPLLKWFLPEYLHLFCWALLAGMLFSWWRVWRVITRNIDGNGGRPVLNKLTITESGIRIVNPDKEKENTIRYDEIQGAWRTKNLLFLSLGEKQHRTIDLRSVAGGTEEELLAFLGEHLPCRKIPRRMDTRIRNRILAVAAAVCILTSTGGSYIENPGPMSPGDGAEILGNLGITGITDGMIQELEQFRSEYDTYGEYNAVPDLLYFVGFGEYDPEDWTWTPSRNGVYTFDWEAWEVSLMYTNVLNGISAMSGGELEFTDIEEDNSQLDAENGTGTKYISFTFRNERYTLTAEMIYDWMDGEFFNQLGKVVNEKDGRKLYYLITDGQLVSIFYRDDSWAKTFRRETGYSLTTQINGY